jgi:hypothetical protein
MKTTEVTIEANGHVTLHVQGVQGMRCMEITEDLERALGGQRLSHELTEEAYAEAVEVAQATEGQTW